MDAKYMEGVEGENDGQQEINGGKIIVHGQKENGTTRTSAQVSYRGVFTGMEEMEGQEKADDDMVSDDEWEEKDKENNSDCLAITITKKEKIRLRKPWKQSLIIKMMSIK